MRKYKEKVFIECSGSRDKIETTFRSEEFCHLGTNFASLSFNLEKKKEKPNKAKKTIASTYLVEATELCVDGDREL